MGRFSEFSALCRRFCVAILLIGASAATSASESSLSIIVPYPAGGGADALARQVAPLLASVLRRPVVVENVSGAGARIGHQQLMQARPDGSKLLLTNSDLTLNQALRKSPPWDIERDFSHIAMIGTSGLVYMVNAKVPVTSMREFIEYARQRAAQGRPISYGSGGIGSILHVPTIELATAYGLNMPHVPYRGAAPLVQDLSAGVIEFGLINPANVVGREDKVRALAITGERRHPIIPNVPTMAEAGFPDVSSVSFASIVGPAGMSPELMKSFALAFEKVAASPQFKQSMISAGIEPHFVAGPALLPIIQADLRKWQELGRVAKISLDD